MKVVLLLGALASALTLGACATFATSPEAANPKVRQLCYLGREADWAQIAPPQNAQAYRDAWPRGAEGRPFTTPHWPEDEFWFRNPAGVTRLCVGNPFFHEERCSAGASMDFTESANGLAASELNEPICIL